MRGTKRIPPILLGLVAVVNLLIIIALPNSEKKILFSDIGFIAIGILVLLCLWMAARASSNISHKIGAAWYFFFAAHFCFVVADLLWGYYEIFLHINPFPSLADVFYLANYIFFLIGIILLIEKSDSTTDQLGTWLDISLVFVSTFLLVWVFLLNPILESVAGETLLVQILTIAYPIGDLLLISALLVLTYKHSIKSLSIPLVLLMISLLAEIITDLIFSFQSLHGTYISGGWTDIGWVAAYWLLGMAGYAQANSIVLDHKIVLSAEKKEPASYRFFESYRNIMPYLLSVITFILLQASYVNSIYTNLNFILIGIWAVISLVFSRQYVTLRENKLLNRNLQVAIANVQERVLQERNMNLRLTSEIKKRKRLQRQLKHMALHDPLTGLPNRVLFLDRLGHALAFSKRNPDYCFAVFFIDLNEFKLVNDYLGHAAGDEALVQFGQRLNKMLRQSDTLARIGGDEFAILVENSCDIESLKLVADRILESAQMTFKVKDGEIKISACMGVVNDMHNYTDATQIINDADLAMYQAKAKKNENMVIFDRKMREPLENPK